MSFVRMRRGFTAIETLVVIAVLSMVVAFGLPVLIQARFYSRQARCTSQVKRLGMGTYAYAQDHAQAIPPTGGTHEVYVPDQGLVGHGMLLDGGYADPGILLCPAVQPKRATPQVPASRQGLLDAIGSAVVGGHYNARAVHPLTQTPTWGGPPLRIDLPCRVAMAADLFCSPWLEAGFPELHGAFGPRFSWWAAPRTPVEMPARGLQHDTTGATTLFTDGSAGFIYWPMGLHYNWQVADVAGGGWRHLDAQGRP